MSRRTTNALLVFAVGLFEPSLCAQHAPARRPAVICVGCFKLTVVSGGGQSGNTSSLLPQRLVAKLTDLLGNPFPFPEEIIFEVTSSPSGNGDSAILSNGSDSGSDPGLAIEALTDSDGNASAQFTLGTKGGQYQVTASCSGCFGAIFTETAMQSLTITTDALPQKTANLPYSFALQATGGNSPYTWSVRGDSASPPPRNYFPSAFLFSTAGVISDKASGNVTPGLFAIVFTVIDSAGVAVSKSLLLPVTCGDPTLDRLGEEYEDYGVLDVTFTLDTPPACGDFTQTARSIYFTFDNLNRPSPSSAPLYNWALIRYPLSAASFVNGTAGLDAWVALLGPPQIVNSGYRSPSQNAAAGGAPSSRHMWGDAADLQNQVHPSGDPRGCNPQYPNDPITITPCLAEYNRMVKMAIKAGRSYVEPPELPCHYNCVHADWRNVQGTFQQ